MTKKIGMLIPTRNRPNEIRKLLQSLVGQRIEQIVVCSSGDDLSSTISEFDDDLPIMHIVAEPGQINQKMVALERLKGDLDWVIFSDDDVYYPRDFLLRLNNFLETQKSSNLLGIGFQIHSKTTLKNNFFRFVFCSLFRIQTGKPGSVQRTGECISYVHYDSTIETEWLNGASVWRLSEVLKYDSPARFTKYAAYEDAVFSHGRFRKGALLYIPELQIHYSNPEELTRLDHRTFKSYCLWKLYFVIEFKLSIVKYLWSTLGFTLLYALSKGKIHGSGNRLQTTYLVWKGILRVAFSKNSKSVITDLLQNLT
jgi:glycosyltransferase involved in cell wall biosynthesis